MEALLDRLPAAAIIMPSVMLLFGLPLMLKKVPPNGVYGFRTEKTMASDENWYRANAFCGWCLALAAVAGAAIWYLILADGGPPEGWTYKSVVVFSNVAAVAVAVVACGLYLWRL